MYQFSQNKKDFLRYRLYRASKSKHVKDKRRFQWIVGTSGFLVFAFIFHELKMHHLTYEFLIAGILVLIFFPILTRFSYRWHYLRQVKKKNGEEFGKKLDIVIEDELLITRSNKGERKIKMSEIAIICEIKENIFIRLNKGGTILIPKSIQGIDQLKNELSVLSHKYFVKWHKELSWKWE